MRLNQKERAGRTTPQANFREKSALWNGSSDARYHPEHCQPWDLWFLRPHSVEPRGAMAVCRRLTFCWVRPGTCMVPPRVERMTRLGQFLRLAQMETKPSSGIPSSENGA